MPDSQIDRTLETLCQKHGVPVELVRQMLDEERNVRHLKIRRGITERIRTMIEKSLGVST
jgi:FAD synthase